MGCGSRLRGGDAWERCDQDHPGLRLPPRVHDRTAAPADRLLVPPPGLRVDWLTDGAEEAETRQVMPFRVLVAPPHERPDRGRGRVQDRDVVFLDHPPESVGLRPIRCAFVHEDARAVREGTVHDVRVAGDPTDVRGAPEQVLLLQVEDVLHRRRDADQIPSRRMLDALRLPRRAGRVQNEERVRGVHRLRLAFRGRFGHEIVPPMVAPLPHGDLGARATEDDHMPDHVEVRDRLVHDLLQREDRPATIAAVRGHDHVGLRILRPIADRAGAEPAEDHAVDGPDPGAGEQGDREFRDHRHVDRHAVAALHAQPLEDVREPVHLAPKIVVRQHAALPRLALPHERGLVPPRSLEVPVEAVRGHVQLPAHEPLREGRVPFEDLRPGGHPGEPLRHPRPKGLGVLRRFEPERVVPEQGRFPEGRRRPVLFLLLQEAVNRGTGHDHAQSPAARPFSGRRFR